MTSNSRYPTVPAWLLRHWIIYSLLAGLSVVSSAADTPFRQLNWDDLVPPAPPAMQKKTEALRDRFVALSEAERDLYRRVETDLKLRRGIAAGKRKPDDFLPDEQAIYDEFPSGSHPDIAAFWEEVEVVRAAAEAQNSSVREDLHGQRVRIPGYMLPLDQEGQSVREFLLVPYVGACIHTPPPPMNQIVFVKSDTGVTSKGLFEPVWVEGTLKSAASKHSLFMVDGRASVETGYALDALTIEPYEE